MKHVYRTVIEIPVDETQKAVEWVKLNQMIVNPKQFQVMFIFQKRFTLQASLNVRVNSIEITTQSVVELLGITINNEFKFDKRSSRLCKSAASQLNDVLDSKTIFFEF